MNEIELEATIDALRTLAARLETLRHIDTVEPDNAEQQRQYAMLLDDAYASLGLIETKVDEFRREFLADLTQIGDRTTRLLRDRLQVTAIDLEILFIVGKVAERGFGPDPLTHHARIDVRERFIEAPADVCAEVHEKRERLHGNAGAFERGFQQCELKRRKAR